MSLEVAAQTLEELLRGLALRQNLRGVPRSGGAAAFRSSSLLR